MKILVTGSNGMLGSALCELYHKEHKVYALHRDSKCFAPSFADFSIGLKDFSKVTDVINQIKPDLIIHCASMTNLEKCEQDPDSAIKANVLVTENIAKICQFGTKLIYISTDQIYGDTDDYSESNQSPQPINQYGKTKLMGEQVVRELCPNHLIVRTNIFGWNVKPNRVSSAEWIYNSLSNEQEITLFSDYIFSPMYTIPLGEIMILLALKGISGTINVGSLNQCSKYHFGLLIADTFRFNKSLIKRGSIKDHPFFAKRISNIALDCSKLKGFSIPIFKWEDSVASFASTKQHK